MPQPRRANSSSSIRAQCTAAARPGIVTFTWTRPMQTREIVLPPALPYIIYVIQCLRVTERSSSSSSIQQADCSPHPHKKTWLQTHITPTEVTTGVHMASMHTHICKNLSALTCLLSGLFQTHTHRSLHTAPLPCPTPHPAQSSHPRGLCVRIRL